MKLDEIRLWGQPEPFVKRRPKEGLHGLDRYMCGIHVNLEEISLPRRIDTHGDIADAEDRERSYRLPGDARKAAMQRTARHRLYPD